MDLNALFNPFKKVSDVLTGLVISKLIPARVPDRLTLSTKLLGNDYLQEREFSSFTDKIEKMLPLYGDDVNKFIESAVNDVHKTIVDKFIVNETAVRHLLPPVRYCCDKDTYITKSSKCVVFERLAVNTGLLRLYKASCKTCTRVYYLNFYTKRESTRESVFQLSSIK